MPQTADNQIEQRTKLAERVLNIKSNEFDVLAFDIYRYQYRYNPLYRQFCELIGRTPGDISDAGDIPHLPIGFFKNNAVMTGTFEPQAIFESSTTTGQVPGRHYVASLDLYDRVAERCFESAFGSLPGDFTWYGLLPSYLERPNASLVHMVRGFIRQGGGGFYMDDLNGLRDKLEGADRPVILIGVTFALLELAAVADGKLPVEYVIETGGMKGRREELTRGEVHATLMHAFDKDKIGSEYGMTELLSQAWSHGDGIFKPSPTLKISIREISDPFASAPFGVRGAINCIDLANLDSCAFIATDDSGVLNADGSFKVLGRLDGSEQRGCNLMFPD